MSDLGEQVTFQVCHASLQRSAGELLPDDGVKSPDAVRDHQTDSMYSSFPQPVEDVSPAGGAFLRHVE